MQAFKISILHLKVNPRIWFLNKSEEITATPPRDLPKEWRTQKDLSLDNIICEISKGVFILSRLRILCNNMAFVSQI